MLNGTPGSMVEIFDKVLVNGWDIGTILFINVEGNIATVTYNSITSEYINDTRCCVKISGVGEPSLNGTFKIIDYTSNTVSFMTGAPEGLYDDGGTIGIGPLGWTKPFSNVSMGVYRSPNPISSGYYYRVDDTAAQWARVTAFRSMENLDFGKGEYPKNNEVTLIGKSSQANTTPRFYMFIGDDRGFYIFTYTYHTPLNAITEFIHPSRPHYIGDYVDSIGDNNYNSCLALYTVQGPSSTVDKSGFYQYSTAPNSNYTEYYFTNKNSSNYNWYFNSHANSSNKSGIIHLAKTKDFRNDYQIALVDSFRLSSIGSYNSRDNDLLRIDPYTNRLLIQDTFIFDNCIRGKLPGLYYIENSLSNDFHKYDFLDNSYLDINDRLLFSVFVSNSTYLVTDLNLTHAYILIDFSEWRNKVW